MDEKIKQYLIKLIEKGENIPESYKSILFPSINREYELSYFGKMRKEDLLANEDGTFPAPLQIQKQIGIDDKWKNMIVFGDNLHFLKTIYKNDDPLIKDKVKGKVKLIYIDPPFATESDFNSTKGQKAYSDKIKGADFIESLRRRLILAREVLSEDGSIFVHLDSKMAHYIKIVLDEIFGKNNIRNEIIWAYTGPGSPKMKQFNRKHDTIFWYTKSSNWTFNDKEIREPYKDSKQTLRRAFGEDLSAEKVDEYRKKGKIPEDWWEFAVAARQKIDGINRTGYPTEKPYKLIERIIKACTNENDIVMDFFCGSGMVASVSERLNRKWITCDIGKLSYYTIQKRILKISEAKSLLDEGKIYGKKPKSFVTCQIGLYDLNSAMGLEWGNYKQFVSELFELSLTNKKIGGIEFEGLKNNYLVKIWNYQEFKDSNIDEQYIDTLHKSIGDKVNNRIYLIAPANNVDFIEDYIEKDGIRYYFLKIPYQVIRELHKRPFQKIKQPQSSGNVNNIDDTIGFHFIKPPKVQSKISYEKNNIILTIEEFKSDYKKDEEGKLLKEFETLSAIYIDYNYDENNFNLSRVVFADEFIQKTKDKNNSSEESLGDSVIREKLKIISGDKPNIVFAKSELGKKIMIVYVDIYGNDFTEIIEIKQRQV